MCPHCLATGTTVLMDEIHIICHCPATKVVLGEFTDKFQRLTRLLDLPPFASSTPDQMTRLVLGNPPPTVLNKNLKGILQKPPQSVVSSHTPSACMSHPSILLLYTCPLMMMPHCRLMAMMISHLSYFHLVSSQRPCHHLVTCLYHLTQPENR